MAARDHVHPLQMQMFIDPEEQMATIRGSTDLRKGESMEGMWSRKLQASKDPPALQTHGAGIHEALKKQGVKWNARPAITVEAASDASGWMQTGGHHRIVAAADLQRTTGKNMWLPIEYR